MILAIDAGNSRVKWAIHDGDKFIRDGWAARVDLDDLDAQWTGLPAPSSIVIGNVAGDDIGRKLQALCRRWKPEPHWAVSVRSQGGVFNHYDEPSQLGVDRWAALIGARTICPGACVVANAGTAMTVDGLGPHGEFIGGIVVPGFEMMHEALAINIAKLAAQRGKFVAFPRTTSDAITSGAVQALCGAVERMRNEMVKAGNTEPDLIVSGGAGEMIARHIGRPVRVVDKLVLQGLVRIAMEQP